MFFVELTASENRMVRPMYSYSVEAKKREMPRVLNTSTRVHQTRVLDRSQSWLSKLPKRESAQPATEESMSSQPRLEEVKPPGVEIDPMYIFGRGLQWFRDRDTNAGWELLSIMQTAEGPLRALAAMQLTRADHLQIGSRKLNRALARLTQSAAEHSSSCTTKDRKENGMRTPYGLQMIESCLTCPMRQDDWFCCLSDQPLTTLSEASHLCTYPDGALLFVEGQAPRGAYVLCSGKVKLTTTSREGKVLILKIAEAGDVLGLSAVISGQPYEITAETDGPCQLNFIQGEILIEQMANSGELGLHSAQTLSREFQMAYRDIHDLVLSRSSAGKLAKLLLSWTSSRKEPGPAGEIRVRSSLTHEEMAQMIGASRETVTRLLGDLKKKDLIRLEGSTLVIRNRTALEALAA